MAGGEGKPMSTLTIVLIVVVVVVAVAAATVVAFWWWSGGTFQPPGMIVGSGDLVTEEKDFSDFTVVSVGWAFDVEITRSSSYNVNITADDNLFEYIEVSKTGSTLSIGLRSRNTYQAVTLRAEITMPDLHELGFSGATHGSVEGFDTSHDFVARLSGASSVTLTGGANDLLLGVSGASMLDLSEFPSHDASVSVSGASQATVNLDGHLAGDVSGASRLYYLGQPTLTVNTSGGSTVGPKP